MYFFYINMQWQLFEKCKKLPVHFNQPGTVTLSQPMAWVWGRGFLFVWPIAECSGNQYVNIIFEIPSVDAQGAEITHFTLQMCQ